jgi:DNA (cytosine-5)-methyltransferase 1
MAKWLNAEAASVRTGLPPALLKKIQRHGLLVQENSDGLLLESDLKAISTSRRANSTKKPRVASFFAGCGGLDLGLKQAGFQISYSNDFDLDAATTYRRNFGHIDVRSIREVQPDDIGEFDLLTGGFPCQPFSNAGSRKGTSDPRGTLFWEALRFVNHHRPKVVLFENVRGILSILNPDGSKLIDGIHRELIDRGYRVSSALLNASIYGVPQNRQRVIIIGLREDLFQEKFDFELIKKEPGATIREALQNVETVTSNNIHWELSPQAKQMALHIPEGGSWKSVPYELLPERLKRIQDNIVRYRSPNFYRRFSMDEIMGTVTAAATPENSGILHPTENRRYTVREIARFQTFPDDFVFEGKTIASMYRQIGNAVPPLLAKRLGYALRKHYLS